MLNQLKNLKEKKTIIIIVVTLVIIQMIIALTLTILLIAATQLIHIAQVNSVAVPVINIL